MIGREDAEDGTRVEGLEHVAGEAYGGGGVTLCGLGEDLALGDFRELAGDFILEKFVGEDPDTLRRKKGPETVYGLLDEAAFTKEVEDLLGLGLATAGPETGATAAGEDEAVIVGARGGVCHVLCYWSG